MDFLADANPYIAAPSFLNSGDTAWQLTAATFVGMQSIPGLAILYAGLVKKKWALNSAVMCFYAFSIVLLCWVLWGYNMSFGVPLWGDGLKIMGSAFQVLGIPHPAIGAEGEIGQAAIPLAGAGFPPLRFAGSAMIYFQFVFAAITPILIAGSVLGRMNFKAWMLFVPLWSSLVYTVGAFALWGGGWLAGMGAVDYSGGYVIHLAAGVSGFVAAAMVGPRLLEDRKSFDPNNLIVALAGAGILWLGWNGFNGGDPYFANADAAAAVLNTNIATAVALLCWLVLDMFALGKPSAVSMINGMIVGLVAITPAAGYVDGYGAIATGGVAALVAWFSLNKIGQMAFMKRVDDTFGVLHTHGVAGLMGGLCVGLFANPNMIEYLSGDKKTSPVSVSGLFFGNPKQLWLQFFAAVCIIVWNVIGTYIVLKIVSLVVKLRASDGEVEGGDLAIHGIDPVPSYLPPTSNGTPVAPAAPVG
ncbi:ammonium transporter [Vulcanimicrobium alpinum]|uniref:Ammonium transporter n=1 Tax=Vulcanimicrobium alpinum TaxID=3016050 RepID=A0AAN2C8G9_UNVUL|nr:ammonium transporter [Vulcanimicrobium alpinum]BDE04991.1 ammonium transporter [Vulcanimicrobium alpinum]